MRTARGSVPRTRLERVFLHRHRLVLSLHPRGPPTLKRYLRALRRQVPPTPPLLPPPLPSRLPLLRMQQNPNRPSSTSLLGVHQGATLALRPAKRCSIHLRTAPAAVV